MLNVAHTCTHIPHTATPLPGFITMTPQLFINYKLKSVAHLPWRMLTYKALNTFIDDMFAFVIKMPTMYRIGCFRDGQLIVSSYTVDVYIPATAHVYSVVVMCVHVCLFVFGGSLLPE